MKTLEEIKLAIAKEHGCESFKELLDIMADGEGNDGLDWFENTLDRVAKTFAKEVVKELGDLIKYDFPLN